MENLYFQWHVTNVCNFRCKHCYQGDFTGRGELDFEGLRRVSDRIIQACGNEREAVIDLTGGEPFLKKELPELLEYLDGHREIGHLGIITNGSLIDSKLAQSLNKFKKLRRIKVSFEGGTAETNDFIRGEGAFEKARDALKILKENTPFSTIAMFTAMKRNANELKDVFEFARARADGLIVERFFPMGLGSMMRNELLDKEGWHRLVSAMLDLAGAEYGEKEILPLRAFWAEFKGGAVELLGAACNVGRDAFAIMPGGGVYPCRRFNLKIGNLLEQTLREIVDSSVVLRDLQTKRRKGRCGECDIEGCRGCPALAYLLTGDYLAEDSMCRYRRD